MLFLYPSVKIALVRNNESLTKFKPLFVRSKTQAISLVIERPLHALYKILHCSICRFSFQHIVVDIFTQETHYLLMNVILKYYVKLATSLILIYIICVIFIRNAGTSSLFPGVRRKRVFLLKYLHGYFHV